MKVLIGVASALVGAALIVASAIGGFVAGVGVMMWLEDSRRQRPGGMTYRGAAKVHPEATPFSSPSGEPKVVKP